MEIPNLALTATTTKKIQDEVYELLGFQREEIKVIAALPNGYCNFFFCFTFVYV
jgi:superfamily II DNA helicase RecQ